MWCGGYNRLAVNQQSLELLRTPGHQNTQIICKKKQKKKQWKHQNSINVIKNNQMNLCISNSI